jgi:hypothetical protein
MSLFLAMAKFLKRKHERESDFANVNERFKAVFEYPAV